MTTSSVQPSRGITRRLRQSGGGFRSAASCTRRPTRVVLHRRRGLRAGDTARQRPMPGLRRTSRARERGKLFLQAFGIRKTAARVVRAAAGLRDAGDPEKRSRLVREGRPQGLERQPHVVQMGHSGSRRPQTRDVCLVRRADELHHCGRISGRHERFDKYWPADCI